LANHRPCRNRQRSVRAQAGGLRLEALAEADPPHRLISARVYRLSEHVTDDRVAAPPAVTAGRVPAEAMALARRSLAEFAPPGLSMAVTGTTGAGTGDAAGAGIQTWSLALGWADLDRPEPLRPGQRFMTGALTQVVTATVMLRLVADGRVELDAPAGRYLRAVRLADPEVTVRELLSHTGGVVDDPARRRRPLPAGHGADLRHPGRGRPVVDRGRLVPFRRHLDLAAPRRPGRRGAQAPAGVR
jgi:CubicO group peptidase (beta-lactamase class C family)